MSNVLEAISKLKLKNSKNHFSNPGYLQARCPSCHPDQQCQRTEGIAPQQHSWHSNRKYQ